MSIGLVGQKSGMSRKFQEDGTSIPITILQILPNYVTQVKTKEIDGYIAIQVSTGKRRLTRVTKSLKGHYAKAQVEAGLGLWEFRVEKDEQILDKPLSEITVGTELTVKLFEPGQKIDVSGTTKGRGFTGVIRRHNFSGQDRSHGNSLSHRAPGSIGQNQTPGRVFKGKKMAGHYGNEKRTIQNLEVVAIDEERNLLMVKGGIPGSISGTIIVRSAVKFSSKKGKS